MSNKVKEEIDIKNRTYYFFNDITNIKNFYSNNVKIDEKSYKNILIYYTRIYICYIYIKIKDPKSIKINSVNPLYLIFNKVNEYFEEINENKYLMLNPTNESKEKVKKYEKLWRKIRYLTWSITKS